MNFYQTGGIGYDVDADEANQEANGKKVMQKNIIWPNIGTFDENTAGKLIEDYIRACWVLDPKWMVHIAGIQKYSDKYRKKYIYEVS